MNTSRLLILENWLSKTPKYLKDTCRVTSNSKFWEITCKHVWNLSLFFFQRFQPAKYAHNKRFNGRNLHWNLTDIKDTWTLWYRLRRSRWPPVGLSPYRAYHRNSPNFCWSRNSFIRSNTTLFPTIHRGLFGWYTHRWACHHDAILSCISNYQW